MTAPQNQGQMDSTSLQLILEAINRTNTHLNEIKTDLSSRIATLDDKFSNLSEAFLPRREANEAFQGVREQLAEHKARITALEEFRLSQSEKVASVQVSTQDTISSDRKEQDARTVMFVWGLVTLILGVLLSYVFSHLIH